MCCGSISVACALELRLEALAGERERPHEGYSSI